MKILFISGFVPYPPVSGNLQRNYNLIREISKKNQIDLVTLTQQGLHPNAESLQNAIDALRKYCHHIKVFEIPAESSKIKWYLFLLANLFSLTPFTVWKYHSKRMQTEIQKRIKESEYDVIHFDSSDVAQYHNDNIIIPSILNHHNIESSLLLRRSFNMKNPLKKFYLYLQGIKLKRYERRVIKRFDLNICVSAQDVITLKRLDPNVKTKVVPNGTDTDYFKPNTGMESKRLIFAGPLSWYPNADAMIHMCRDIYPLIKQYNKDIHLDIIGHSPPKKLRNYADAVESIHLLGFVEDIRTFLALASVYVVPIYVGGGTRLKILDAMASGKAVVSTSIGCEGLDVEDRKNILIADSPEKFSECVNRLLADEQLRKRLESNGRRFVEDRYSWGKIGQYLASLYKSISSR